MGQCCSAFKKNHKRGKTKRNGDDDGQGKRKKNKIQKNNSIASEKTTAGAVAAATGATDSKHHQHRRKATPSSAVELDVVNGLYNDYDDDDNHHNHHAETKLQSSTTKVRHHFSDKVVLLVYSRTGGKCYYCMKPLGEAAHRGKRWNMDHFHAFVKGGADDVLNLVPSCRACNASKYDHGPAEFCKSRGFALRCRHINIADGTFCLEKGARWDSDRCIQHFVTG